MKTLPINLEDYIPGSSYFKWYEALWLPSVEAFACPNKEQQDNIIMQAAEMDRVRAYFSRPIIVTSWLRPEKYNKMIGGALSSAHIFGLATDFVIKGIETAHVKGILQEEPPIYGGRGEIDTTNWIHLDLKPGAWFYSRKPVG